MDSLSVLIIEDDNDTANFFSVVLSMVGFDCEIVQSAKLALARLAATQPDMILLDMRLGLEIGGEDILYQIRSNPRLDQARVIVITGYPSLAEPVTDLADLILLKPVEVDQLKTLASRLMLRDQQTPRDAYRDTVTNLFTQDFLSTRLELAFERFKRHPDFRFAVQVFMITLIPLDTELFIDMDRVVILRQFADGLRHCYRPTDTLARTGTMQFVTLHEGLKHVEDIHVITRRLHESTAPIYRVDDRSYSLEVSLGAAVHTPAYRQPGELIEAAQNAMLDAQRTGEDQILLVR